MIHHQFIAEHQFFYPKNIKPYDDITYISHKVCHKSFQYGAASILQLRSELFNTPCILAVLVIFTPEQASLCDLVIENSCRCVSVKNSYYARGLNHFDRKLYRKPSSIYCGASIFFHSS